MAYLHCHNCGWNQDDFWSDDGWNPVKSVKNWKKDLFSPKIDEPFTTDVDFIRRNGNITLREVIARRYEQTAKNIRGMKYRTHEEFKQKNPDGKCPVCHHHELDID